MIPAWNGYQIARVVLETQSPLSITDGQQSDLADTHLIRDANGLPTLPASAIAGALRHLAEAEFGPAVTEQLFGCIGEQHEAGQLSQLGVSWGLVHDQHDQPVEQLLGGLPDDPCLQWLAETHPLQREQVRLDQQGVAVPQAKFDRSAVPVGTRFTLEIQRWCPSCELKQADEQDDGLWHQLLRLFSLPHFRLGGAGRSGFGQFKVIRLDTLALDLRRQAQAFACLPVSLTAPLPNANPFPLPVRKPTLQLQLVALDHWRIGGDYLLPADGQADAREAPRRTLGILAEPRIQWSTSPNAASQTAQLSEKPQLVIPGSAVKGALRHRTQFHLYALADHWADAPLPDAQRAALDRELDALFGWVREDEPEFSQRAGAGALWISDSLVSLDQPGVKLVQQPHVAIDRLTGGALHGALFTEQLVHGGTFELALTLSPDVTERVSSRCRAALALALRDLANSQLALGAAQSRGHGYFRGRWLIGETLLTQWLEAWQTQAQAQAQEQ